MIDVPAGETWTPYLQRINQLFIEEKQARHEGDNAKLIKICTEIVAHSPHRPLGYPLL